MDRKEAKAYVKTAQPTFLQMAPKRVNGQATYICPACGNGSGSSGDGIVPDSTGHYHCFKCGLHEDTIGLWEAANGKAGMTPTKEDFDSLYRFYGITVDDNTQGLSSPRRATSPAPSGGNVQRQQIQETKIQTQEEPEEPKTDYTNFFLKANENIKNTDYLQKRGITNKKIIDYFKLGYVEGWKPPSALGNPKVPVSKRLIIPVSRYTYTARNTATDSELSEGEKEYKKQKIGSGNWTFNAKAVLNAKTPVWIVEGELDAVSIYEAGGEALALGSTSYVRKFLNKMIEYRTNKGLDPEGAQPFIVALDPDKAGRKATEELYKGIGSGVGHTPGLEEQGFKAYEIEKPYGEYKDANEALVKDRALLVESVERGKKLPEEEKKRLKKEYILEQSAYNPLKEFTKGISENANTPAIPTGFRNLDSVLEGGLFEGLYILGAISSLGKTTLVLQIADQIAEQNYDVLMFSLEMARTEIISKTISRYTLLETLLHDGDIRNAKTSRGITTSSRYANYSSEEIELIADAINQYAKICKHIFIHEGIGDIGAEEIKNTVKKHIEITGKKPVVIIDYLQILAPYDIRATDKQNTDKAVLELKRLSRDCKIPVIGISSLNRTNYNQKINMGAFKESGSIEYSSDVLIGLQLKGVEEKDFDVDEAKKKTPREIEMKILKNRNGATGQTIDFEYNAMFNYFSENEHQADKPRQRRVY